MDWMTARDEQAKAPESLVINWPEYENIHGLLTAVRMSNSFNEITDLGKASRLRVFLRKDDKKSRMLQQHDAERRQARFAAMVNFFPLPQSVVEIQDLKPEI